MSTAIWTPPKLYTGREQTDFERRFHYASLIKDDMRLAYGHATRRKMGTRQTFEDCQRRAREFWEEYENINRHYIPEDPVYSKSVVGLTTTTTNDIWEMGAAAAGQMRVLESFVGGENTASTVGRIQLHRVTTQGTGTAPTLYNATTGAEKFNTRSPNAASTVYGSPTAQVAWGTTQATLATNPTLVHGLNTFGGADRWVAQPGEEIYCVNAEFISLRAFSTTPIISAYVVFEEL